MKQASLGLLVAAVVGGCTPIEAPIESFGRFDVELGAAREKRRVVALASPT